MAATSMRASPARLVPANSSPPSREPDTEEESPMPRMRAGLGRRARGRSEEHPPHGGRRVYEGRVCRRGQAHPDGEDGLGERDADHPEAEHGQEVAAAQATPRFEEGHEEEQEESGQGEARCGEEDRRDALDDDLYRCEVSPEEEDR